MSGIRLLIVDDAAQVRQGLRTLLPLLARAAELDLEIVGEAANGCEAVAQAAALRPDVVLLDLAMPGMDGCTAARAIKSARPAVRIVAFSVHCASQVMQQARLAGADAFVAKGAPLPELLAAIRA